MPQCIPVASLAVPGPGAAPLTPSMTAPEKPPRLFGANQEMPMSLEDIVQPTLDFVRTHQAWAAPIVFALAFAESLAFLSLLVPAWGALVAIGAMVGAGNLPVTPVWIAGALGAALGDWLSFWVGDKFKERVFHMWPLSTHPDMLPRAEAFVRHWGVPGIFIGRFFGPLRASVPLVAGVFEMPYWHFQIANVVSAFVWAGVLLVFGDAIARAINWIWAMF